MFVFRMSYVLLRHANSACRKRGLKQGRILLCAAYRADTRLKRAAAVRGMERLGAYRAAHITTKLPGSPENSERIGNRARHNLSLRRAAAQRGEGPSWADRTFPACSKRIAAWRCPAANRAAFPGGPWLRAK